jgi:putative membrane protein
VYFFKNRKGDAEEVVKLPNYLVVILRLEMVLIFLIPLLAVLMAQGRGGF